MRRQFDFDACLERARAACFICELVAGNPEYQHQSEADFEADAARIRAAL